MPPDDISPAESVDLLRKQIGTARTLLLIVAIATLISALLLLPGLPSRPILENIILTGIISVIYFILAVYTKKKPYTAVMAGLLLLLLTMVIDIVWNPFGPFSRWQSKILTLLLLALAIGDSKDAQRKMSPRPGAAA
jgi:lysylphosphatidylglycerol synthetase-like protein (DUF2156 family)